MLYFRELIRKVTHFLRHSATSAAKTLAVNLAVFEELYNFVLKYTNNIL